MAINLEQIQNTIGYKFDNTDLLQQAFVRRSYSEENGGQNNEVLEFIGDKALDLAVIRIMVERFGEITEQKDYHELKIRNPKYFKTRSIEGQLTDIKKDLVQKNFLAKCMADLGFHNELIMGKGDINSDAQEQDSVKEDLFEAIIGAVAIDSDWDMDAITDVVKTMIDFDAYFENEHDDDYVRLLQEWSQQNGYGLPDYQYYENDEGFDCYVTIGDICSEQGSGYSQAKARADAANQAYSYLEENGYIVNVYQEAVGEPDEQESLRQMNELVQKGLISKPDYVFTKEYDGDGNALWTCECIVEGNENTFTNTASSKKEAQRLSAYEMLLDLMDMYYDEDDE